MELAVGTSRRPLCLVVSASVEVWVWRGLRCSMEAQEEEEEEGRGRSAGEAGRLVGFIFSIMVVETSPQPSECVSVSVCVVSGDVNGYQSHFYT